MEAWTGGELHSTRFPVNVGIRLLGAWDDAIDSGKIAKVEIILDRKSDHDTVKRVSRDVMVKSQLVNKHEWVLVISEVFAAQQIKEGDYLLSVILAIGDMDSMTVSEIAFQMKESN